MKMRDRSKKQKKIKQKWPDVDNPRRVCSEDAPGKRSPPRTSLKEKNRRCTFRRRSRERKRERRTPFLRSGGRLILFWKLGLAWPWQTRHLKIVYDDPSISRPASRYYLTACPGLTAVRLRERPPFLPFYLILISPLFSTINWVAICWR